MSDDIRWQQRLDNYVRALAQLQAAVGLIQTFEFTHELAWNVMKDYFAYQGQTSIMGSRDATCAAFAAGLIEDGEGWMEMIVSRNQSSHTYNRATAEALVGRILHTYAALFDLFAVRMTGLRSG